VGNVAEADADTDGDADGESDGCDEPVADAAAPDVALPVARAEGDATTDTLGGRLAPALGDSAGLGDAATERDTVGEHDATGSMNGTPTAEPTPTAHAFVLYPPPEPAPSNTIERCASNTRNDAAGSTPRPLPHAHPLDDDAPLPGDCAHVA